MNDLQLDELIYAAQVNATDVLSDKRFRQAGDELLEQIMSETRTPEIASRVESEVRLPRVPTDPVTQTRPLRVRVRRVMAVVAAAASVAAAIVLPTLIIRGQETVVVPSGSPAQAGDLFLIDEPGWVMSHASAVTRANGELWFRRGAQELQITWYQADDYEAFVRDRRADDRDPVRVAVLGREGLGFSSRPDNHSVLLAPIGRTFLEIREWSSSRESFQATLGRLRQVTGGEWNAAAAGSPDVVVPAEERTVARAMLEDVSLPPGFRVSDLPTGSVSDYAVFGRRVMGQVTCSWLADYRQVLATGPKSKQAGIETALRGNLRAKVMQREVSPTDRYPESYVETFRQVVDRAIDDHDFRGYRSELGCS